MEKEKRTILLVEDDAITALSEKLMLERYGYNVITAISGAKAIDAAVINDVDLVLMDIDLGGVIDGHTAAREILARKNIPVLFLTAHVEKEIVEKVREVTRYGYALKTTGEYVLMSTIEMVFDLFEAHEKTRESEENHRLLVEEINDVIFSLDEKGIYSYVSPRIKEYADYVPEDFTGRNFLEFVHQEDKEYSSRQFLSLKEGIASSGEIRIMQKNGGLVWFRVSGRPIIKNGKFSGIRGVFVDVTDRKIADEQINILLKDKGELIKEINCLYGLSKLMEETPDSLDDILHLAADMLTESCANTEHSVSKIVYKEIPSFSTDYTEPVISIESDLIINGTKKGYILLGYTETETDKGTISFSERDVIFLANASERIGKIIELIKAREDLKKLEREVINISETERRNIGHELHDGLGQILTGVSFMIKSLKKQMQSDPDSAVKKIFEIGDLVNDASRLCRQITKGMPLVNIKHNTLLMALDQLAISTREIFGINCEVDASEDFFIKDDFVSLQLYRIIQEAVNNAVKHSGGDSITISLKGETNIYLAIQDNGKGYDFSKQNPGMGLNIMKYRADLINGKFTAGNHEDGGFVVSVLLL